MKTTRQILHKVRQTTAFRFTKTSLTSEKSLEDDDEWTHGTRRPSSEEFSHHPIRSQSHRSIRIGGKQRDDDTEVPRERPRRRLVFFDDKIIVRRVRAVYEIGGTIDRRELWYQADEYKEIMWKARQLINKRACTGEDNDVEKDCLRGLELIAYSSEQRRANLDGREAVLNEQFDQFQKDLFPLDDHRIASVSVPFTRTHRAEAIERANSDAREVALYHRQIPTQSVKMSPARHFRTTSLTSNWSSTSSLKSITASRGPLSPTGLPTFIHVMRQDRSWNMKINGSRATL